MTASVWMKGISQQETHFLGDLESTWKGGFIGKVLQLFRFNFYIAVARTWKSTRSEPHFARYCKNIWEMLVLATKILQSKNLVGAKRKNRDQPKLYPFIVILRGK